MTITVQAIYQNGMLKPDKALPLKEFDKVQVTVELPPDVQTAVDAVKRSYGLMQWTGDPEVLRQIAEDDEYGILESP